MSKEVSKKLWDLYLSNLETSIKIIDDIIPIVKSFESKCYNKRFGNAINKLTEEKYNVRFYVEDFSYKRLQLDLGFYDYSLRSVKEEADKNGYCSTAYLPSGYDKVTIAHIYTDYNTWEANRQTNGKYYSPSSENHFYIDDNCNTRIGSEKIISLLREKQTYIKEKIKTLTEKFNKLDEFKTKLDDIKLELKKLSDGTPYELKDFFNLKIPSYY